MDVMFLMKLTPTELKLSMLRPSRQDYLEVIGMYSLVGVVVSLVVVFED